MVLSELRLMTDFSSIAGNYKHFVEIYRGFYEKKVWEKWEIWVHLRGFAEIIKWKSMKIFIEILLEGGFYRKLIFNEETRKIVRILG